MDRAELEKLSSKELHDLAVKHAVEHVDVKFLWQLLEAIPVAEAVAGHGGEAEVDVVSTANVLNDAVHSGEGDVAEALRPLYLDYLEHHSH